MIRFLLTNYTRQKEMGNRIQYLDSMKAILIMLVILGHAIQFNIENYQYNWAFRIIYSFHMPLFLAISGYLTYRGKPNYGLIGKRVKQLLIPFVTWALIMPIFYKGEFDLQFTKTALLYPDNGLWFLYNLFIYSIWISVSEQCAEKYHVKQEYFCLVSIALSYLLMILLGTLFNCTQLCWYYPFFLLGYYLHKYQNWFDKQLVLKYLCGGGYLLTVPFWMMREEPTFYQWIDLGPLFSYLYRYLVEIMGTILFFEIGKKMLNKAIPWLNSLGKKTLGIYAFQFVVLHHLSILPIDNIIIKVLAETILTIPICFALVWTVERIKYVRFLLLGVK